MIPQIADCHGLWRRTLLIEADGSRDTEADVQWLQGISMFVDVRGPGAGFAGRLGQHDDVFEWTRLVDLQPPGLPDAGRMSWAGDLLIEVGVHADYTEHWQREAAAALPCWGLLLTSAVLVRVGNRFGWAWRRGDEADVSIGKIDGTDWGITVSADISRVGETLRPELAVGRLRVDDVVWDVKESEGSVTL
ncbi:hypothetical protein MSZK_01010 [Mycobacterium sp. shizuoka-1]|nr:hypothetical protein MSZK_01010 [Mycobacterium sp. shizuoka-1]